MKLKIFGFISLSRNQFIIIETVFFIFFFLLTVIFFSWTVPEYVDDPSILFNARYLKYITLVISFLIVVETQYYLNKFIAKQLEINESQRQQIELQNEEIMQSIRFARHIQESLLPRPEILPDNLEFFIFNKPRNIVSGDFYWFTHKFGKTYIVAADCTGHGVPGAFMSVLGISSLNDIFAENNRELTADEILNILREKVIASLTQKKKDTISEAGMDLSIIKIDPQKNEIEFSGAKNPVFIISKKTELENIESVKTIAESSILHHVKADKMPIGLYPELLPFTKKNIKLNKGDTVYMFSDGFVDQMGGTLGKKLMNNRFKAMLLKVQSLPVNEQKEIIDKFFNKWKGDFEQTDDVLLLGIKI